MSTNLCLVLRPPGESNAIEVEIPQDRAALIGRNASADLFVNDPRVSRRHCEVRVDGDRLLLVDLGSASGTAVNGRRVDGSTVLRVGDRISIADLSVEVVRRPATSATSTSTFATSAPTSSPPAAQGGDRTIVGGPGTILPAELAADIELRIDRSGLVIGRAASADLILDHPLVSREHCRLILRSDRTFVQDAGATNGTFINGQRVTTQLPLLAGDVLTIGPYQLNFDGHRLWSRQLQPGARLTARAVGIRVIHAVTGKPLDLLRDVSLTIEPGEFVALLGASGSGKSTMMGVLNGRRRPTSGAVLLDQTDLHRNFDSVKADVSYIPQQVIFHDKLPVRDALRHVARLRLPRDTTEDEVVRRVNEVITQIGLDHRKDTVIDQLSGGQLKRVSIGMELLVRPRVLFLDEVTSGLDPASEREMSQLFRELANEGVTIVSVTHHTGSLELCDLAIYLTQGRLAYCGPPDGLPARFGGERIEDVYSIDGTKSADAWEREFLATPEHEKFVACRADAASVSADAGPNAGDGADNAPPELDPRENWRQFRILLGRTVQLMRRDSRKIVLMLALAPLIALILRFVTSSTDAISRQNVICFSSVLTLQFLGLFGAIWAIVNEQSIYRHERNVNLRIVPYVTSKAVPLAIVGLAQSLLVLLVIAGALEVGVSVVHVAALWMSAVAGTMLGLAISAWAPKSDWAALMMNAIVIPQILFADAVVELKGGAKLLGGIAISSFWAHASLRETLTPTTRDLLAKSRSQPWPDTSATFTLSMLAAQIVGFGIITLLLVARKDGPGGIRRFLGGVATLAPTRRTPNTAQRSAT